MVNIGDGRKIGGGGASRIDVRKDASTGDGFALRAPAPVGAGPGSAPVALESLGVRLSELRRSNNLTQIEVAFRMGTTQPTLARLEKGEAKPNLRTLSRYAEAIGQKVKIVFSTVPADKRSADKPTTIAEANNLEAIPATLGNLRRQIGITQSDVAARMNTTQPVIARLEGGDGDGVPNLRTLERYSEAIGVGISIAFDAVGKPKA